MVKKKSSNSLERDSNYVIPSGYGKMLLRDTDYKKCNSYLSKLRGLMFTDIRAKPILIEFYEETKFLAFIHTFFMFYPIRIYWLDENREVVDMKYGKTWRIYFPRKPAKYVLEVPLQ